MNIDNALINYDCVRVVFAAGKAGQKIEKGKRGGKVLSGS